MKKSYSLQQRRDLYYIIEETIQIINNLGGDYRASFLYDDYENNIPVIHLCTNNLIRNSITAIPQTNDPQKFANQCINKLTKKINYKSTYKNLEKVFRKIGIGCLYYTSYGFGFSTLYLKKSTITEAEKKLNDLGVQFRTELSDANWIYRFRILQSKENIQRILDIK